MNKSVPRQETRADPRRRADEPATHLKVLHVISGLGLGGAETVLFRLAAYSHGTEHEVICLGPRDWYSDRLEERGIPVHHIDSSSPIRAVTGALRLHRLIRSSSAEIVQGWMYRGNVLGGISSRIAGKPVVWNIRCSSLGPLRRATRVLARVGGALAPWIPDYVINCSVNSARLHARFGYDATEGGIIANGYDPDIFHPDDEAGASLRQSLGIPAGSFIVGTIGRWHPQKGYPELLQALRLLRDRKVPVRLLMVGRGLGERDRALNELIDRSGCREAVQAIGERSDIPEIARMPDLHVLASVGAEGFPNVVAETMLSGTPNVVTDIGDAATIVGETGWVVPAHDPSRLADAIEEAYGEWVASPEQWQRRRERARQRIVENFTLDRMVEAYETVWRQVAAKSASSRPVTAHVAAALPPTVFADHANAQRVGISVVIPLYNKEAAIESTLASVLAQTRAADELIIIDDGSTDRSVAIAEEVLSQRAGKIPWRIISQENAGEGATRNRGAEEASCDYIAFLDADDEWLPDYLSEMERLALGFPSATVLTIRNSRRNARGVIVPGRSALGTGFFGIVDRPIEMYRRGNGLVNSSAVAIRRDAWQRSGGFHVGAPIGSDVTMWLKLGLSETFAHSGRALSVWRDEYSGVMARKSSIPEQLRYFLGTDEGRRFLDNADLAGFLSTNIIVQIGVYSLVGNTDIRSELRRLAGSLPLSSRLKCGAASMIPPSWYRGLAWWRRRSRERLAEASPHSNE